MESNLSKTAKGGAPGDKASLAKSYVALYSTCKKNGGFMASLTIPLNSEQLAQVLRVLKTGSLDEGITSISISTVKNSPIPENLGVNYSASAQQFRQLLRGSTEKLVRFVVKNGQEFFNDQLAEELQFDNPAHTSSVLGKVTLKLRRVGVRADGHLKTNWYTTHKEQGKTLLRIRPDVFRLFKETIE